VSVLGAVILVESLLEALLVIYSEIAETIGYLFIEFVQARHAREGRSCRELHLELIHCTTLTLSDDFYAAISEVLNRAKDFVARCGPQHKVTIAYSLNASRDHEATCDLIHSTEECKKDGRFMQSQTLGSADNKKYGDPLQVAALPSSSLNRSFMPT